MPRVTAPLIKYSHLGLVRLSVFAHPNEAHRSRVLRHLQSLPYWTYWAHSHTPESGIYVAFAIPHHDLEDFRNYLQGLPDFARIDVVSTGDPVSLNSAGVDVGGLLRDPEGYVCEGDEVDVRILEQLEENPSRTSGEIAARTGLLQVEVKSHLIGCVQRRGLMVPRRALGEQGEGEELWILRASFSDHESMAGFVNGLRNGRLTHTAVKVLGREELVVHFYLDGDGSEEHRRHLSHQPGISRAAWWRIDLSEYGKTYGAWTIRSDLFDGYAWRSPFAVENRLAASV